MATTVKFVSVPSKTLASSINAAATSIQISDIKGWDGVNLSSANFGDVLWCVLRDSSNTVMEIMKLDPTTIANSSITILVRGLDFSGGLTEVTANKLTWIKNDTIVELGSNPPQLLSQGVMVTGNQTIADLKTFSTLPQCTAVPTVPSDLVNKSYADGLVIAGALAASTTVQGYVQEATQAQIDARTVTGSTTAKLFAPLDKIRATKYSDPLASTGSANAYVLTVVPAVTAYATGQVFSFIANFANTGAATLNVSGLGAIAIKKNGSLALISGDIASGQVVTVVYDGTNMQMTSPVSPVAAFQNGSTIYAADAGASDSYAVTLVPAPSAYVAGMVVNFKANTLNTGAATLNVNALGAIAIVKSFNTALDTGDIKAGQFVSVIYDGTNFQMVSPVAQFFKGTTASGTTTYDLSTASGTQNIPHGLGVIPKVFNVSAAYTPGGAVSMAHSFSGSSVSLYNDAGAGNVQSTFRVSSNNTSYQTAVITADATNIILTWTKTTSPTGTASIAWQAIA